MFPVETDESSSEVSSTDNERRLEIHLSHDMKMWLEQDFKRITHENKLLKLPSNPNIITILEDYFKTWAMERMFEIAEKRKRRYGYRQKRNKMHSLDSAVRIVRVCREVMDGIRISFDFTLSSLLLYNKEREQYDQLNWLHSVGGISPHHNDSRTEENLQILKLNGECDHSVSSSEPRLIILHVEQEETSFNEVAPGNQVVWNSCLESLTSEVIENSQTSEAEIGIMDCDTTVVSGENNTTQETETENWELQPDINLETSTDENSDKSPLIKNDNIATCDVPEEPAGSEPPNTNTNNFGQRRKRNKRMLPRLLTRVSQVTTRSMTENTHSRKRVEMSKAYAILSSLLEKPFAPQNPNIILPSCFYGPVHLARLFVKLPEILQTANASCRKLKVLSHHLHMFLSYLEGHPQWFSEENYKDSPTPAVLYPSSSIIVPMQSFFS